MARIALFRALRSGNYRLFFAGQTVSLVGTWMQRITVSWLVYRLTGSALLLGAVGFAGQVPTFLASPFAGALVDRWNRYHVMVITQVLSLVQAALFAWLALSGRIQMWQVFVLSAALGLINAFDVPARQAFVIELVEEPGDLSNAIALNSTMVNGARMAGPAIAGTLLAFVGEGVSFLLNALSFIAVLAALLAIRVAPKPRPAARQNLAADMLAGFRYASGHPEIRLVLGILSLVSLVAMPYQQLMPVIAAEVLHGGPRTLGFLMAAAGAGAIVGTLGLASLRDSRLIGRVQWVALVMFGASLIGFSMSRTIWVSLLALVAVGMGMMVQITAANTRLQALVEDAMRGRVMGFYAMSFMGMGPLGSLIAGWAASYIGAPLTLGIGGAICLVAAVPLAARLWHPTASSSAARTR